MTGPDWFGTSEVLPLFPTFVWKTQLTPTVWQPLNEGIRDMLRRLAPKLDNGEAWQSQHDLHEDELFAALFKRVNHMTNAALEFLRIGYREFEVTACWATINAPGRAHRIHRHPNSFLSGVYYVQTDAGADTINFHDPRIQPGIIRPPVTELVAANADQTVVAVADGTLLLFPSWLEHSVDVNAGERDRISVSFNIMFSEYTERLCKPLWGE
jgi:uncharacterized protein (TIGR02466 family)